MAMDKYIVYVHTSPNGKRYVGITGRSPNKRWKNGKGYSQHKYFFNAIKKYGWDNFTHEILAEHLSEYVAKEYEKMLIKAWYLMNRNFGYNNTEGGEGISGHNHTEETKRKISKSKSGKNNSNFGKKFSDEHRKNMGIAKTGENNPCYGKFGKDHPNSKKVICITTKIVYDAGLEAMRETGIDYRNISACCRGKAKSAGKHPLTGEKLAWRYYEDIVS